MGGDLHFWQVPRTTSVVHGGFREEVGLEVDFRGVEGRRGASPGLRVA